MKIVIDGNVYLGCGQHDVKNKPKAKVKAKAKAKPRKVKKSGSCGIHMPPLPSMLPASPQTKATLKHTSTMCVVTQFNAWTDTWSCQE